MFKVLELDLGLHLSEHDKQVSMHLRSAPPLCKVHQGMTTATFQLSHDRGVLSQSETVW